MPVQLLSGCANSRRSLCLSEPLSWGCKMGLMSAPTAWGCPGDCLFGETARRQHAAWCLGQRKRSASSFDHISLQPCWGGSCNMATALTPSWPVVFSLISPLPGFQGPATTTQLFHFKPQAPGGQGPWLPGSLLTYSPCPGAVC